MDIKQLKFLIALEETRHFGQAAARCHVTQPTLSMRLRSLEEELGLELVIRGQRFEGFTDAGQRVLAWARTLLAAHDGLYAEAAACRMERPATRKSAAIPAHALPARMRASPCATRMRLFESRRTTSATVPSATRSSSSARFGSARAAKATPRSCSSPLTSRP